MRGKVGIFGALSCLVLLLQACSGGGGNDQNDGGNGDVTPPPGTYTVSATVTGVSGNLQGSEYASFTLRYTDEGGAEQLEQVAVTTDGPFTFSDAFLPNGSIYDVSFRDAEGFAVKCKVENGAGTIASSNVTDVAIACVPAYTVGGEIKGIAITAFTAFELQTLHNSEVAPSWTTTYSNSTHPTRPFHTGGNNGFLPGDTYDISVSEQPGGDTTCFVRNGSGVVPEADVVNVEVLCSGISLHYEVTGLSGSGLVLRLYGEPLVSGNGSMEVLGEEAVVSNGFGSIGPVLYPDQAYRLEIHQQPTNPNQECFIENGEGTAPEDSFATERIQIVCPTPYRSYRFDNQLTQGTETPLASGEQTGGVLYRSHLFGEHSGVPLGSIAGYGTIPRFETTDLFQLHIDNEGAEGVVYSNASGKTFWAAAESPLGVAYPQRGASHHNLTDLTTWWLFKKESESANLQLEVSEVYLLGFDDTHQLDATGRLYAEAQLWVKAYRRSEEGEFTDEVFSRHGGVALQGKLLAPGAPIDWSLHTATDPTAAFGLWNVNQFFFDLIGDDIGRDPERVALAFLVDPIPIPIDVSDVPVGELFWVNARTLVLARNSFSPEGGTVVFLRDPATFDAGDPASPEILDDPGSIRVVAAEGVTMLAVDSLPQPAPGAGVIAPRACESDQRSVLELDAAQYRVAEGSENSTRIQVVRAGPIAGPVTVRIRIDGDTAEAGEDFEPREIDVRFGDLDNLPRTIELPTIDDDTIEPEENLTVTLIEPQGCAEIGALSSAVVTIVDDDTPRENEAYTLGGTVTGLEGTGLTLTNLSTNDLSITSDGPFTFARTFGRGSRYEVRVASQPTQPRQFCSLTNGSGTIGTADVNNILVNCSTLPDGTALDPSFGVGGRAEAGAFPAAAGMALQSDGRIVVVGPGWLGRFNADGTADAAFGTDGSVPVQTYGTTGDVLNAVEVQTDGRILIAGYARDGVNSPTYEDWIVARYDEDGAVDSTFARVIVNFARGDEAHGILLRSDGSAIVTGTGSVLDTFGLADANFAALHLLTDGTMDHGFGVNGLAAVNVAGRTDLAYASALQPDGKVVIAGRVANSGGDDPDIGLVRFNADGTRDASFGTDGVYRDRTDGSWDEAADVVLQPDGKILVVGQAASGLIARYNTDGTPDQTFGTAGRVTEPLLGIGRAIALQPDGRIVAAGVQGSDFAIVRFTPVGELDTTFGTNGVVEIDFFGGSDDPAELIIQPDGRILVAGSAMNGTSSVLALVRIVP